MSKISTEQANALDKLGDFFPGLGKTDGITPAKLGSFLNALEPIVSPDGVVAAGAAPDAAEFDAVVLLVNEIKASINAACLAAKGES